MSEEVSVKIGNCTNCTGCGLCGKDVKSSVITDSLSAPAIATGADEGSVHKSVVAVDLGTTTIAMYRLDALTGEQLGVFVSLNPQQIHGADVLSRICAASDGKGEELQQLICEAIAHGVEKVSKEPPELIVVAGNTVMQYLLMGYDPTPLGSYPFIAEHNKYAETQIQGIKTIVLPGLSAFIGGDIVAGLYTLEMAQKEEINMLIDLGTNGEIVIGNKEKLLTTSAAAGPAFDNKFYGTQMIAAVATLLKEGKVDETGCLSEEWFETGIKVGNTMVKLEDIRSLQQAKAAIRAGIELAVKKYGCSEGDLSKVYLAGGFGYYLDLASAIRIGLFPPSFADKLLVAGNTSLEGAYRYAMDCGKEPELSASKLSEICDLAKNMNLAEQEEFSDLFISQMSFPTE